MSSAFHFLSIVCNIVLFYDKKDKLSPNSHSLHCKVHTFIKSALMLFCCNKHTYLYSTTYTHTNSYPHPLLL